jgi:hypothetical protein
LLGHDRDLAWVDTAGVVAQYLDAQGKRAAFRIGAARPIGIRSYVLSALA